MQYIRKSLGYGYLLADERTHLFVGVVPHKHFNAFLRYLHLDKILLAITESLFDHWHPFNQQARH
jgi:hypothetical protein